MSWIQNVSYGLAALSLCLPAAAKAQNQIDINVEQALETAIDAYIYGYSLITTDVTRYQQSNVAKVESLAAPLGSFLHIRAYPPADFRGVSGTNVDTLYSVAWLDLTEPMVFSHPEINDRFFTFQLVDYWMTVKDSVGTNTVGSQAATYLFTMPDWKGEVPAGMIHMTFPTRYMVILGRTYALDNEEDLNKVHALQDQYKIVPLSSYGKPYEFKPKPVEDPGFSMKEAPQNVIKGLGVAGYFNRLAALMEKDASAAPEDAPIIKRMATLGIVPGKKFDLTKLDSKVQKALEAVPDIALKRMEAKWKSLGRDANGWRVTNVGGRYGTDYLLRGAWAALGWPSQLPEVSVYPTTYVDGNGDPLQGGNAYTITFKKGDLPPVHPEGFWSLTLYIIDNGLWFYPNAINRRNLSTRDNFVYNEDGSLTLYYQHDSPGKDKESNWQPIPEKGPFAITLRMYWPNQTSPSVLNETWVPPPVVKLNEMR